jgi:2-octaprenyl-6-methoxyphenol hydroxylase
MIKYKKPAAKPQITIVGGGPVGLLSALCLTRNNNDLSIRLISGRRLPAEDGRAAALVGRSMQILADIGLEDVFRQQGAPLAAIRIIDATGRLLRAPTTTFRASDAGMSAFGVSLSTAKIVALLHAAIRERPAITVEAVDVQSVSKTERGYALVDDEGRSFEAGFVIAADGQRSLLRERAGIAVKRWDYPQVAMTFAVSHPRDHEDVSTEFHTAHGPFTLVPAGDCTSTVVWMASKVESDRLMALDDDAFALAAEKTCHSLLGRLRLISKRGAYPMAGLLAERFSVPGMALVGETAHAFPPIGAQGMNLGFRDADTLSDALTTAIRSGHDLGDADCLESWDQERRRDAGLRTAGVDLFNRSLLSDLLPVNIARGLGLAALQQIPPLRRAVMRMGLGS